MCKIFLPSSPFTRILRRRACASPRLEQLPTSKVFLLSWRPCLNIERFYLKISKITPEQHLKVMEPECQENGTGLLCSATVCQTRFCFPPVCRQRSSPVSRTDGFCKHLSLKSVSPFFTEAWRIACKGVFGSSSPNDLIDEFSNHRMLTCTGLW